MDINFHYFMVKTLARYAGFIEREAQRIATYSQYVDDFDWITLISCKNIPDYIKNDPNCDLHIPNLLTGFTNFNPAMTGFVGYIDLAFTGIERTQRFTVSPFHFMPESIPVNERVNNVQLQDVRTKPAKIGDASMISSLLASAKGALLSGREESRNQALMRIGMYLHIFADTYAHQGFSGYNSEVNEVKITNATNNATGEEVAMDMWISPNHLPPIGHARAGHIPDLTFVTFTMECPPDGNGPNPMVHTRNNTDVFLKAAKRILNYLRSCRNLEPIQDEEWAELEAKLRNVLVIPYKDDTPVSRHVENWEEVFGEYAYQYNPNAVVASFTNTIGNAIVPPNNKVYGVVYTDEFYRYNQIADEVLVNMYGSKPRKAFWS